MKDPDDANKSLTFIGSVEDNFLITLAFKTVPSSNSLKTNILEYLALDNSLLGLLPSVLSLPLIKTESSVI